MPEGVNNPTLFMKKSDGTYQKIKTTIENGYLVYETDELGMVSVIGDKKSTTSDLEPTPNPEPKDPVEEPTNTKPPVQGNYVSSQTDKGGIGTNMGGVSTGDSTNLSYVLLGSLSMGILLSCLIKFKKLSECNKNR